jgi:phage baseplate assembly protein W
VRHYEIQQGDSLRAIAYREYGTATRWRELADLNNLKPPHIVDSYLPAERLTGTVIWGDIIRIPTHSTYRMVAPADELYGRDIFLDHGNLAIEGGDLARLSGVPNLAQALNHRVKTLMGELHYHPEYGCYAQLALGLKLEPIITLMGAGWVREALLREPRVAQVEQVTADAAGDRLSIAAQVLASGENTPIDLNIVVA